MVGFAYGVTIHQMSFGFITNAAKSSIALSDRNKSPVIAQNLWDFKNAMWACRAQCNLCCLNWLSGAVPGHLLSTPGLPSSPRWSTLVECCIWCERLLIV